MTANQSTANVSEVPTQYFFSRRPKRPSLQANV
jgi:hypothetical protein